MNIYNQAQDSKKLMFVLYVTLRAKILRVGYNECNNKCAFFVFHEQMCSHCNQHYKHLHALSTGCASCCRLPALEMCVAS